MVKFLYAVILSALGFNAHSNDYFNAGGVPATGAALNSATMRGEFSNIGAGFDKLPALTGNGSKAVTVNAGGTALTVTTGTISLPGNFALSGASAVTLTTTGSTNVTLPTTGTLSTLAGTEELTNKTLNASVGKGTWTTSGTWTLPAITLGGTVSGGGNQLNNVIIGTSTPLAGAFTTLSTTGAATLASGSSTGSFTANTFASSGATLTGGTINSMAIGGSTPSTGAFTTLSTTGLASPNTLSTTSATITGLTSGRIALVSTGGLLADSSTFSYTNNSSQRLLDISASGSVHTGIQIVNTHASGEATFYIQTNGTGDAYQVFTTGGSGGWYVGNDASASGGFAIGTSTLGSSDWFRITTAGAASFLGTLTANTFASSGATLTGGTINSMAIGGSTPAAGAFTTLSASSTITASGGTITTASATPLSLSTTGGEQVRIANTGSAVNYLQLTGATSASPTVGISTQGSSTNIDLVHSTKGSGTHYFQTGGGTVNQMLVTHTASATRTVNITGSNGGNPAISASAGELAVGTNAWTFGIANTVSPTSPNRTLTVTIGATTYYIAGKTSND